MSDPKSIHEAIENLRTAAFSLKEAEKRVCSLENELDNARRLHTECVNSLARCQKKLDSVIIDEAEAEA